MNLDFVIYVWVFNFIVVDGKFSYFDFLNKVFVIFLVEYIVKVVLVGGFFYVYVL